MRPSVDRTDSSPNSLRTGWRRVVVDQRGDLLIDAVVGTVLLGLAAALIGPLFNATGVAREVGQKQAQAASLASTILEDTQAVSFSSVTSTDLATTLAESSYPNIGTPAQGGWQVTRGATTYSVSLAVAEVWGTNGHERRVTVSVSWPGGGQLTRSATVTDSLTSAPPAKPEAGSWISEFFFSSSHGSFMIAAGPDGNLWFTEPSANKIGKITTEGKITEYAIPTAYSSPGGITGGPDGNVWFTESSANKIARITPAGAITEFPLSSGSAHQPIGITSGPDGRLWFAEYAANKIGRITTAGAITEFALPTTGTGIQQITRGPDGRLWFTEWFAGKVGKITTSGSIVEYTLPSDLYRYPLGITSGPDGNLWFVEWGPANKIAKITTSGQLTEYPIPTESPNEYPYPYGIAAGADGNLWFTLQGGNRIGRITTAGAITQYKASTASGPTGIAAGPDGNLWFTEYYTGRIGRISSGA